MLCDWTKDGEKEARKHENFFAGFFGFSETCLALMLGDAKLRAPQVFRLYVTSNLTRLFFTFSFIWSISLARCKLIISRGLFCADARIIPPLTSFWLDVMLESDRGLLL